MLLTAFPLKTMHLTTSVGEEHQSVFASRSLNLDILGQKIAINASKIRVQWSFFGGSRVQHQKDLRRNISISKGFIISASRLKCSLIASNAFTWGTVSVLPFYTLMLFAPSATLTKRAMKSNAPYVVLGLVYAYLLYLSWTPDTFSLMFSSKYWLPELSGITKMFMNEMTLASAWIHLLAVDLHAARQVFSDGMKNNIETRHSVFLCLLFCPIGILVHAITKLLTKTFNLSH